MRFLQHLTSKFVTAEKSAAAGGVFYAQSTGQICLAKRSRHVAEPLTWSTWGGKIDKGETPEQALVREVGEEANFHGKMEIHLADVSDSSDLTYYTFICAVNNEFKPQLNWETDSYTWTTLDDLPAPLHPGFKKSLPSVRSAIEKIAKSQIKSEALGQEDDTIEKLITEIHDHPEFLQRLAKKYLQLKDRFYQPFDKGLIEPRNGGFVMKETLDVVSKKIAKGS